MKKRQGKICVFVRQVFVRWFFIHFSRFWQSHFFVESSPPRIFFMDSKRARKGLSNYYKIFEIQRPSDQHIFPKYDCMY